MKRTTATPHVTEKGSEASAKHAGVGDGVCGLHSLVKSSVLRPALSRFYPRVQRSHKKKGCEQSREM